MNIDRHSLGSLIKNQMATVRQVVVIPPLHSVPVDYLWGALEEDLKRARMRVLLLEAMPEASGAAVGGYVRELEE